MAYEKAQKLGVEIQKLEIDMNAELGDKPVKPIQGKITTVLSINGHL